MKSRALPTPLLGPVPFLKTTLEKGLCRIKKVSEKLNLIPSFSLNICSGNNVTTFLGIILSASATVTLKYEKGPGDHCCHKESGKKEQLELIPCVHILFFALLGPLQYFG